MLKITSNLPKIKSNRSEWVPHSSTVIRSLPGVPSAHVFLAASGVRMGTASVCLFCLSVCLPFRLCLPVCHLSLSLSLSLALSLAFSCRNHEVCKQSIMFAVLFQRA